MIVGDVIWEMLDGGTARSIVKEIWRGNLPQTTAYPAVTIKEFGTPDNCKDGQPTALITVQVMAWAQDVEAVDDIATRVINDLNLKTSFINGKDLRSIRLSLLGPLIQEEEKDLWGRPVDFDITINQ